jgi:hypothetical protein
MVEYKECIMGLEELGRRGYQLHHDVGLDSGRFTPETKDSVGEFSPEMREFMGVDPLQFTVVAGERLTPLQTLTLDKIREYILEDGGSEHSDTSEVNSIFFPSPLLEEVSGMWDYGTEFKRGVGGVSIVGINEFPQEEDLEDLSLSRPIEGAFVLSMEGSRPYVDFSQIGEDRGFKEVASRLTHLAGGRKASHFEIDRSMPSDIYESAKRPEELIKVGSKLREMGILPDIRLENYVSDRRARQIRILLNVTGLSIGNFSSWDQERGVMWITGSGFDKGDLSRDQIVAINEFLPDFKGTRQWAPEGAKEVKQSVESIDQLAVNAALAAMESGLLKDPSIPEFFELVEERGMQGILSEGSHEENNMTHVHVHPKEDSWNPNLFYIVDVSGELVPKKTRHSSCGCWPLVVYGLEAVLRGYVESNGKIVVARWPNHGIQVASPLPISETLDYLDPANGEIAYTEVTPV